MTKPSKFWLYLGIVLVCSGVGVGFGAVLLGLYFWSDLKNAIYGTRSEHHHFKSDYLGEYQDFRSPKWYDGDTAEKMK